MNYPRICAASIRGFKGCTTRSRHCKSTRPVEAKEIFQTQGDPHQIASWIDQQKAGSDYQQPINIPMSLAFKWTNWRSRKSQREESRPPFDWPAPATRAKPQFQKQTLNFSSPPSVSSKRKFNSHLTLWSATGPPYHSLHQLPPWS